MKYKIGVFAVDFETAKRKVESLVDGKEIVKKHDGHYGFFIETQEATYHAYKTTFSNKGSRCDFLYIDKRDLENYREMVQLVALPSLSPIIYADRGKQIERKNRVFYF